MNCGFFCGWIFEVKRGFCDFVFKEKGSYNVEPIFENNNAEALTVHNRESLSEIVSLSTDSDNILETSITILKTMGINVLENKLELSLISIVKRLDKELPLAVGNENSDFLIISTETDKEAARQCLQRLYKNSNLIGILYNDSVSIGADFFESFENFASRTTKLIFYLTDDFVQDEFCSRLVSLVYLYNRADLIDKVVPIMAEDSLDIELPRCLQLVDKLWLGSQRQIETRWPRIWTPEVRQRRVNREQEILQNYDSQRLIKLREFLAELYGVALRR